VGGRGGGAVVASRRVPPGALHLVFGDGRVGAGLVAAPRIADVVFTASTAVATAINRARGQGGADPSR
jgi:RHH-type transcriptional regulator, proline utilization regulon repressor / proline dehydrogenase / delta 1-pyrroline-5-carboxylate dehydrogenase